MACQNQIQASEQPQVSVPTEIVVEILLRLSVKSLLRCRSVCKLWHSLISDPYFLNSKYLASNSSSTTNIDRHRLIFSNRWRDDITICNLFDALYDKSVSYKGLTIDNPLKLPFRCDVSIAASCNGLVCFTLRFSESLFIWNPTTRVCNRISLDFSFRTYGFGYDESTDGYKFFAICQSEDKGMRKYSLETRIYSVKTGMWKAIGGLPHCEFICHVDGKYSNGALHWVGHYDNQQIVSFHLATETYGHVLQPEYDDEDNRFCMSLGALGEELCMLCYYYEKRRSDIWVMKVYGVKESWTKLFSIPCMHKFDDSGIIRYKTPLYISNDGKILFEDLQKLFVYDSKNGSYSDIQNFEFYGSVCIFVESLVSPMPTPCLDNNDDDTFVESSVSPISTSSLDNNDNDPWANLTPIWHWNLFD